MKKVELKPSLVNVCMQVESRKIPIRKILLKWGKEHYRHFAWRENRTPYSVLVSEIILKRTTASAAKRMYNQFMVTYPNLEALAKADKEELKKLLKTIGYHKRRTKILIEVANYILNRFNGQIPRSKKGLLEIPFVGPYTANAVLSLGYGIPSAMVDSNVERIIQRLFFRHLSEKKPLRIVQIIADMLAPEENNQNYNFALLDFGALVCRYGLPKCKACPINKFCDYYRSGKQFKGSRNEASL